MSTFDPLAPDPLGDCPRLLADFEPLPGRFKSSPEDFVVEELPLYEACGAGTHVYFLIEKRSISTHEAIHRISERLGKLRRDVGYAGLKDALAVTRQWLSIEHVDPVRVEALDVPGVEILRVERHGNKLKLGHLAGNRFQLRIRDCPLERESEIRAAVDELTRRGVPNYFGPQRFGARGDGWAVGREIVRDDPAAALDRLLGHPGPHDREPLLSGRRAYETGDWNLALQRWPRAFRDERRALSSLARGANKRRAFGAIDPAMRNFYVAAYQSYLFNRLTALRMPEGLDKLQSGDLAWLHARGAVFLVEDPTAEQERCDRMEISPSGPLYGSRMTPCQGRPGEIEQRVLDEAGLDPKAFHDKRLRVKGSRRALRFPLNEAEVLLGADESGPYLQLSFALPRGCYATGVLRELFRAAPRQADSSAGDED